MSVFLRSEATPEQVVEGFRDAFLVEVSVADIRALCLDVVWDPQVGQPLDHCNMVGRKTMSKCRQLAKSSQWVPGFSPLGE